MADPNNKNPTINRTAFFTLTFYSMPDESKATLNSGRSWFEINPTYSPAFITEAPGQSFKHCALSRGVAQRSERGLSQPAGDNLTHALFFSLSSSRLAGRSRAGVRRPMFTNVTSINPSPQPSPRLAGRGSCFRSVRVSRCAQPAAGGWDLLAPTRHPCVSTAFILLLEPINR